MPRAEGRSLRPVVLPRDLRPAPIGETHVAVHRLGLTRGGRRLFRDMTWQIPRGAFVAVTGPSGAGKSSLLACLAGLIDPSEGEVEYGSTNGAGSCPPAAMRARLGLVFQNLMLTPNAPVLRNVLCGRLGRYPAWRTAFGFPRRDRRDALAWLAALEIDHYARRPLAALSGGEQQRVAVARALFQEAEVILADEPVSNLDPALAERVVDVLGRAAGERRATVFCVLHHVELLERYADFVLAFDPAGARAWTLDAVAR
jgi:phosphonate transport system ATP-binding protein